MTATMTIPTLTISRNPATLESAICMLAEARSRLIHETGDDELVTMNVQDIAEIDRHFLELPTSESLRAAAACLSTLADEIMLHDDQSQMETRLRMTLLRHALRGVLAAMKAAAH